MKSSSQTSIADVIEFSFKNFTEKEGQLVPITGGHDVDFVMKRIFYVYGVPKGETRGKHAHHECSQVLVCLSGSVTVKVDDGTDIYKSVLLNRPHKAVHIPAGIWAEETYGDNCVLLVLCSHKYAQADYIHDYKEFVEWKKS